MYLYKAKAVSDHVWVTPVLISAFPALILLALGLAAYVWSTRRRGRLAPYLRVSAIVVAVAAVAYPIYTVAGVRSMSRW
jgi:hypothetical protein